MTNKVFWKQKDKGEKDQRLKRGDTCGEQQGQHKRLWRVGGGDRRSPIFHIYLFLFFISVISDFEAQKLQGLDI